MRIKKRVEISYLLSATDQMTRFCMKCNDGLKLVNFNHFQYPAAATTEYWEVSN